MSEKEMLEIIDGQIQQLEKFATTEFGKGMLAAWKEMRSHITKFWSIRGRLS